MIAASDKVLREDLVRLDMEDSEHRGPGMHTETIVYSIYLAAFIILLGLSYLVFSFSPVWIAFAGFLGGVIFVVSFAARLMYRSPA